MEIFHTIRELRDWRKTVSDTAFVPTMGNLHAGHLSLVARAKREAAHTVASIFVNRIQFGENEDFDRYPRTLAQDAEKLRAAGVSVLFAPDEAELYPDGAQQYFVEPPALQHELCGATRPIHFRGVATVVAKLFNIVQPTAACFGKKDYQQVAVIRGMVGDLNFPVRIIAVDTERDADGLALSSRNQYLGSDERAEAPRLYRTLQGIAAAVQSGSRDFAALERAAAAELAAHGWQPDYVEICTAGSLKRPDAHDGHLVALAAARLGGTRLIDNLEFEI